MKTIIKIRFGAHRIPGGLDAILGPAQCGREVVEVSEYMIGGGVNRMAINVTMTLDATDERVTKVLALLAPHGEDDWLHYEDIYTEEELQNAPLLDVRPWGHRLFGAGIRYGTAYDISTACPKCGAGVRQTSTLIIDGEDLRSIEKLRLAGSHGEDFILHDVDVDRLLAANVTGALFWPVSAKGKSGNLTELRRQQVFAQHVMPPMARSSTIERKSACQICHRGGFTSAPAPTLRFAYRAEDLKNIQDFNLTWEFFGAVEDFDDDMKRGRWPIQSLLVTPKVMNLLRGKTKKEQKTQGCDFIPIWIEDTQPT